MIEPLVVLSVFSGWPEPEPASHLHLLLLCVLGPLALGLVIAAIGWTPRLMRRSRSEAAAEGLGAAAERPDDAAGNAVRGASARRALDA